MVKEEFTGFKALKWNCKEIRIYQAFISKFLSRFDEITIFDS